MHRTSELSLFPAGTRNFIERDARAAPAPAVLAMTGAIRWVMRCEPARSSFLGSPATSVFWRNRILRRARRVSSLSPSLLPFQRRRRKNPQRALEIGFEAICLAGRPDVLRKRAARAACSPRGYRSGKQNPQDRRRQRRGFQLPGQNQRARRDRARRRKQKRRRGEPAGSANRD